MEELFGEVKKTKLFNDTDIENAVIEVSRKLEKQLHIFKTSQTQLADAMQLLHDMNMQALHG